MTSAVTTRDRLATTSRPRHDWFQRALIVTATTIAFVWAVPLAWMVLMSLTPTDRIFAEGVPLGTMTTEHYRIAWSEINMPRLLTNSAIVSAAAIMGQTVLASMAGYAFARLRFPGRGVIFASLLITMMVPFEVLIIPLFQAVRWLPFFGGNNWAGSGGTGALNTHVGIALPNLITVYGVFLFRQFFLGFPRELEEAAIVDGASRQRFFWRILVPLAKAPMLTMGLLAFLWTWNDFLWPLVAARDADQFTVQIGLASFNEQFGTRWGPLMAGSVISTAPVIGIFLLAQRYFLNAGVRSGVKG